MKARRRLSSTTASASYLRGAFILLALFTASPAVPGPIQAQEPVIEEQVPLDAEGRVLRLDPELATALGLFGDMTNVREILLFRSTDGYVLEVTRRRGGELLRAVAVVGGPAGLARHGERRF
ncbi:MAG TPA: hypothetical protein VMM83_01210, partial [Longimicrobiales bacterium]|nr:hypothetical protein [Longimicrobiales bacterium]